MPPQNQANVPPVPGEDVLRDTLQRSHITDEQRQQMWNAYHTPGDENAFTKSLNTLDIQDDAKQTLYDMRWRGFKNLPTTQQTQGPIAGGTPTPGPSHPLVQSQEELNPPLAAKIGALIPDWIMPGLQAAEKGRETADTAIRNFKLFGGSIAEDPYTKMLAGAGAGPTEGGAVGMAKDIRKIGVTSAAGFMDWLQSPGGLVTGAATAAAPPIAPYVATAFATQQAGQAARAYAAYHANPTPENLQTALTQAAFVPAMAMGAKVGEESGPGVGFPSVVPKGYAKQLPGFYDAQIESKTSPPTFRDAEISTAIAPKPLQHGQTAGLPFITPKEPVDVPTQTEMAPAEPGANVPNPAELINQAGLVNRGELVKGSGIWQVEHPEHQNVTATFREGQASTPQDLKNIVASKLEAMAARPPGPIAGQEPSWTNPDLLRVNASDLRGQIPQTAPDVAQKLSDIEFQNLLQKGWSAQEAERLAGIATAPLLPTEAAKPEIVPTLKGPVPSSDIPTQLKFRLAQLPDAELGVRNAINDAQRQAAQTRVDKLNSEVDTLTQKHIDSLTPEQALDFQSKALIEAKRNSDLATRIQTRVSESKASAPLSQELMAMKRQGGPAQTVIGEEGEPIRVSPALESTLWMRRATAELIQGLKSKEGEGIDDIIPHKSSSQFPGEQWEDAKRYLLDRRNALKKEITDSAELFKATQDPEAISEVKEKLREFADVSRQYGKPTVYDPRSGAREIITPKISETAKPAQQISLNEWNDLFEKKLNKKPDETDIKVQVEKLQAKSSLFKRMAAAAIKALEAKAPKGKEGEAGFAAITGKRIRPKTELPKQDEILDRAEKVGLGVIKLDGETPAPSRSWISPDGKSAIDVGNNTTHEDAAWHLFTDKELPNREDVGVASDTLRRNGFVRKNGPGNYHTEDITPATTNAISNDVVADPGRYGNRVTVEYESPMGRGEVNVPEGWTDLSKEISRRKATRYDLGEEGVVTPAAETGKSLFQQILEAKPPRGKEGEAGFASITGKRIPSETKSEEYKPVVRIVLSDLSKEVGDISKETGTNLHQAGLGLLHFLSPKAGVSEEALTTIFKGKGGIDRSNFEASRVLNAYRKAGDKLPHQSQIDFIDRMKTGKSQATPELQALADTIRSIDARDLAELREVRPGAAFMEDHFRLLYKVLPGGDEAGFKGWFGKRPLTGSGGMLHQHVFNTLSDAMEAGGVPITTNPVDLFLMGHADVQRFIHMNKMWDEMKYLGFRDFVRMGDRPAPGFVPLNDKIANVYFPAESGEGLVHSGKWYVDEGFGRLLNNYLSKDYIRSNVIGRKMVDFKNATTGFELFGPFHAVAINFAAISEDVSLGFQRALNVGVRQGRSGEIVGGIKQIAQAPLELLRGNYGAYRDGSSLMALSDAIAKFKYGDKNAVDTFMNSDKGKLLLKQHPDAENLFADAIHGGLNMRMSTDMRSNIVQNTMDNFRNNQYIRGSLKLPFVAFRSVMDPLFDNYIPRIKLGMFAKDMSVSLKEHAADILSGKVTREQLARESVDRIENIFGEMNYDNLFWNKTFKTALQLDYRSVTWRHGTLRLVGNSFWGQAKDLQVGRLNPNMGFLLSEVLVLGATGAVVMKLLAHKNPQDMADLLHPQTGDLDQHGKPVRINVPGYMSRDIPNILTYQTGGPVGYALGGRSAFIQRALESWNNKNFSGAWVANPNDPYYKQFVAKLIHILPGIMMQSTAARLDAQGVSHERQVLALMGFTPSRKSIDLTPAEQMAEDKVISALPRGGRDPDAIIKSQAMGKVIAGFQSNKSGTMDVLRDLISQNIITPQDIPKIQERLQTPYFQQTVRRLTLPDILAVNKVANPAEKQIIKQILPTKIDELINMPPEKQAKMLKEIQSMVANK